MSHDVFSGKWKEVKGKVKEQWGKLSDDDIARINGRRDQFIGVLQQRYGYEKNRAEKELDNWLDTFGFESEVERDVEIERDVTRRRK